jgi:hypothetical protein
VASSYRHNFKFMPRLGRAAPLALMLMAVSALVPILALQAARLSRARRNQCCTDGVNECLHNGAGITHGGDVPGKYGESTCARGAVEMVRGKWRTMNGIPAYGCAFVFNHGRCAASARSRKQVRRQRATDELVSPLANHGPLVHNAGARRDHHGGAACDGTIALGKLGRL